MEKHCPHVYFNEQLPGQKIFLGVQINPFWFQACNQSLGFSHAINP
jgi:hypothetical protein